jgi:hypothetical protein
MSDNARSQSTDELLGSQARLDALYSATWRQWAREHDAKMEIERLTKRVAELKAELEAARAKR